MDEPFGPEYVRPAQKDCGRCGCCTEALCERGRTSTLRCLGHVNDDARATVEDCPCSAETTKHTAAWRAAQVRITRLARERPLSADAVELLRALAAGPGAPDPNDLFVPLKSLGLAHLVDLQPEITDLGRTYLAALDDDRQPTWVRVVDVDTTARTARVQVPAWRPHEYVTALVDLITADSGMGIDVLSGRWLQADANRSASDADQMVLTGFRPAVPLPSEVTGPAGGAE